jgi:hypothetical protein
VLRAVSKRTMYFVFALLALFLIWGELLVIAVVYVRVESLEAFIIWLGSAGPSYKGRGVSNGAWALVLFLLFILFFLYCTIQCGRQTENTEKTSGVNS